MKATDFADVNACADRRFTQDRYGASTLVSTLTLPLPVEAKTEKARTPDFSG